MMAMSDCLRWRWGFVVAWLVFEKGLRRARVERLSRDADRRGKSVVVCGSEGIDAFGSMGGMALRPQCLRPRLRSVVVADGCCGPGWSEVDFRFGALWIDGATGGLCVPDVSDSVCLQFCISGRN